MALPVPHGAGLLFKRVAANRPKACLFLISLHAGTVSLKAFFWGWNGKNGPEDSIPWQQHHTLPISINYWDTTGFVCSLEITVHI